MTFKNCGPFTDCEINNSQVENSKYLDTVMRMTIYSITLTNKQKHKESLWQYLKDDIKDNIRDS